MDLPEGVTHWDGPPLSAWAPWSPQKAAALLDGVNANWCVVGGWAIDLFLGRQTRAHEDLEIAIPRGEFAAMRERLAAFQLYVVGDGEVRTLARGAEPPPEKHQNWVREGEHWRMDVMLEPGDADIWVFRRDEAITAPRAQMIGSRDAVPYLQPEGALLYKAKAVRPKDEADFALAAPAMDADARAWLREALERAHPDHPWIAKLV